MSLSGSSPFQTSAKREAIFQEILAEIKKPAAEPVEEKKGEKGKEGKSSLASLAGAEKKSEKSVDFFVSQKEQLLIDKDKANGIRTRSVTLESGVSVLVRDATGQEDQKDQKDQKNTYHSWAIMGLNYLAASEKLIKAEGKDISSEDRGKLIAVAKQFLKTIEKAEDPEMELGRMVHRFIVPFTQEKLGGASKKSIQKKLAEARDFCNFDHETKALATITRVSEDKDIIHIDVPMSGLPKGLLKEQYQTLADFHSGKSQSLEELKQISWYNNQPSYIKSLIRQSAQAVLDGKMIPTQLRKFLPGLRNAGEERVYLDELKGTGASIVSAARDPQEIYAGSHSGTPAHLLPNNEDNQDATDNSLDQIAYLTERKEAGERVFVSVATLLTPRNIFGDDQKLVSQVLTSVDSREKQKQEKDRDWGYSNFPLNAARRVSDVYLDGGIRVYQFAEKLIAIQKACAKKTETSDTKEFADTLASFMRQYQAFAAEHGSGLSDPENRNLELIASLNNMASAYNQLWKVLKKEKADLSKDDLPCQIVQIDSCQSGKDRAGIVRVAAIAKAAFAKLQSYFSETQIMAKIVRSGHIQFYAGWIGGTLGAMGVKKDSKGGIPESWGREGSSLIENTASYNKKIPKDPKKHKPFYKNGYFWLGVVGVVVGLGLAASGVGSAIGVAVFIKSAFTVAGFLGLSGNAVMGLTFMFSALVGLGSAYGLSKVKKENTLAKRAKTLGKENPYNNVSPEDPAPDPAPTDLGQRSSSYTGSPDLTKMIEEGKGADKGHKQQVGNGQRRPSPPAHPQSAAAASAPALLVDAPATAVLPPPAETLPRSPSPSPSNRTE